jgi:hypothetical protein
VSWLTDDKVVIPAITALVVAGVTWLMQHRKEKIGRRADRLAAQIDNLYGPLHFYTSENADLLKRSHKLDQLYKTIYCGKAWAQETIDTEANTTIDAMNEYTLAATKNNGRMVRIINKHFALIVDEDLDALREFVTDWNRYKVETKLPLRVRLNPDTEPIAFYRPDFAERIAKRVTELRQKWSRL